MSQNITKTCQANGGGARRARPPPRSANATVIFANLILISMDNN